MWMLHTTPKSGTHLVKDLLERILETKAVHLKKVRAWQGETLAGQWEQRGRPTLSFGHLRYKPGREPPDGVKMLVLIRDPRGVLLSFRDYVLADRPNKDPLQVRMAETMAPMPRDEQIRWLVDAMPLEGHCGGYLEWRQFGAEVLRYEELFDGRGVEVLARFTGRGREAAERAVNAIVGAPTKSLNVGDPNRWRRQLSPELLAHVEARAGHRIVELGYELFAGRQPEPASRA